MLKYVTVRFFWVFLNLLLIISALFIVSRIAMLQMYAPDHPVSMDIEIVSIQYFDYMKGIFTRWDWGLTKRGLSVWEKFRTAFPITLKINVFAFLIYIPFGVILGIISAVKRNTIIDRIISVFTLVFSSVPSFIMIFLIIMIFGYWLDLVPALYPAPYAPARIRFYGLIIPTIALSSEALAILCRLVRGELIDTLDSEFFLLVRTKGLTRRQAIFHHSLRNVMVPVLPVMISTFVYVMGSSFLIERVYNVPGLASWFFNSMLVKFMDAWRIMIDTNSMVIICTFYSLISFTFAVLVDFCYRLVDPRMKVGSKKAFMHE